MQFFFFTLGARVYLKGVLKGFISCYFVVGDIGYRFSLKRRNVIFICIMKCKQMYHQNKVENIRIQADCCILFPLYN